MGKTGHHAQLKMGVHSWGYHKPVLNYPPGCTVKVYMYLLGCKERNRVLRKHIRIKCIWTLQGCELFLKNANKGMW